MPLIAGATTVLYLVAVSILTILGRRIPTIDKNEIFVVQYKEGRGILRLILARATVLGYEASLTNTKTIEPPGKAARVEAHLRFRAKHRGPLEDLVAGLTEIKGVVSVHVTRDEND